MNEIAGRYHCPVCDVSGQHSKSFKVTATGFKCFRCDEWGNVDKARELLKLNLDKLAPSFHRTDMQRQAEIAWVLYGRQKLQAADYLQARGYPDRVLELDYGFATSCDMLQSELSWTKIQSLGLASATPGRELFDQRIVFAVKNSFGQITHFQARSTQAESKCKWLASSHTASKEAPISTALYNEHRLKDWAKAQVATIFLCEGITDALSLECLGLPVVASFGIQRLNLAQHKELWQFNIIAIYDNDQFKLGSGKLAGQEKSWPAMLPQLAQLQRELAPDRKVHVLKIPKLAGVKDTFDFCKYLNWSQTDFIQYGELHILDLSSAIFATFENTPSDLIKHLAGLECSELIMAQLAQIVKQQGGWLNAIAAAFY
jgi:DNA primase catalytic core, N-terminal domain